MRNKSVSAPSGDSRWTGSSPNKEKDPPLARRTRRNSNISEQSGVTPEDKKSKSANAEKNSNKTKQKKAADSDHDSSDDEKKQNNNKKERGAR